jgi:hypothetical protein
MSPTIRSGIAGCTGRSGHGDLDRPSTEQPGLFGGAASLLRRGRGHPRREQQESSHRCLVFPTGRPVGLEHLKESGTEPRAAEAPVRSPEPRMMSVRDLACP